MKDKVVLYVSKGSTETNNRVYGEKYEFPFDRNVILDIISQIRKGGNNKISYYDFRGNEVTIADTEEGVNIFIEFVRQKSLQKQSILVIRRDESDPASPGRVSNNSGLDFSDFVKVFNCEVPAEKKRYVIDKFGPAGTNVFRTDTTAPRRPESTAPVSGALVVTRLSNKDAIQLLKNRRDSQIFVPVENGDFIQIKFRANFLVANNGVFQWGKKPEDAAFKCHQVLIPVALHDGEIIYSTEKSRELMAELGTNFQADNGEAKRNFESTDHTYVKSSQDSKKEAEVAETMDKYVRLDSLTGILNAFKTELKDDIMSTVTETLKKCETSENRSTTAFVHEENAKVGAASLDGVDSVKSEGEDPEVFKFLEALSTIEERLYSVADPIRKADNYGGEYEHPLRSLNTLAKGTIVDMLCQRQNGKVVQLEKGLSVISKSGYKIKMAPNSSTTIRISLFKYYSKQEYAIPPDTKLELNPCRIPREVECCVKPVFKGLDKLPFQDKNSYTRKDISFKTKEKTGEFPCYFNVTQGGKVWKTPLRIDVSVRKLYAHQNYVFGDEANSTEVKGPCRWFSLSSTSKSISYAFPGACDANEREQLLQSTRSNDLIDEGIGGNQEGMFSASSDSDDTDANEPTAENVNDEGIDTQFPEAKAFRFDDDSDSSVSLLLDENEVRDKTDDEMDIVKIPSCFLPNAELSKETIPVRVKRKMNEMKTSKIMYSSDDQLTRVMKQSRLKPSPQKIEESARNAGLMHVRQLPMAEDVDFVAHDASTSVKTEKRNPVTKKSDSKKCDVPVRKEEIATNQSTDSNAENNLSAAGAKDSNYVPLYPNVDNVQDFIDKFTSKKETPNTNSSPPKEAQSPIVILPEKVIEMTSNVFKTVLNSMKAPSEATFNFQKNFDETLSSLSRVMINTDSSAESGCKESSATRDVQNSEVPKNTSAGPAFTSAGGSSPQYTWATLDQSSDSHGGTSPNNNAWANGASTSTFVSTPKTPVTTASFGTSEQSNFWETSMTQSTSVPPPKRQFMEADLTPRNQPRSDSATGNVTPISTSEPKQTSKNNEKTELDEKYNELPPSVRNQLLKLNEMGFMNDNYNLFLIKRYPKDLNKVIESLVNYNDL